ATTRTGTRSASSPPTPTCGPSWSRRASSGPWICLAWWWVCIVSSADVSSSRRGPSVWFVLALLGLDAALVAGAQRVPELAAGARASSSEAGLAADDGWAYCQTRLRDREVTPVTVAITYLEPGDEAAVSAAEVQGWLGDIDPM